MACKAGRTRQTGEMSAIAATADTCNYSDRVEERERERERDVDNTHEDDETEEKGMR